MSIPRFTAEASLYRSDSHYLVNAYGAAPVDGSTSVIPQADCPWWKFFGCTVAIAGCTAGCIASSVGFPVCLGLCLGAGGSVGCVACAGLSSADETTATQAALSVSGGGSSGGLSVPTSPPSRPVGHSGCGFNEKCCERDTEGNCTICIPKFAQCS